MVAQQDSVWASKPFCRAGAALGRPSWASTGLRWFVYGMLVAVIAVSSGCSRAPKTPTDEAQQLMRKADFVGAAKQWEQVLQQDPSVVEAWVGLGQCRFAQDDYRGAVEAYSSAIKIEPENGQLFLYRSDAYEKLNDRAAASADWKRGTELHPDGWARVSPDAGTPDTTVTHAAPDANSSTGSAGMTLPPVAPNLAGTQPGSVTPGNALPSAALPSAAQSATSSAIPGSSSVTRTDAGRSAEPGSGSDVSRPSTPSRLQSPLSRPTGQPGAGGGQPADANNNLPGGVPPQNPLAALAAGQKVTGVPGTRDGEPLPDGLQAQTDESESAAEDDEQPKPKPKPKSKPKSGDQRRRYVMPASPWGSPWQPPDQVGPWGIPMWSQTSEATSAVPAPDYGRSNWGAGTGLTSPTGVTGSAYADTWNSPAGSHGYAGSGNSMVVQTPRQAEGGLPGPTEAGSPWRAPMVRPHSGVMLMDDARLNLDANLGVGPGTGIYQPRYNFNRPSWKEQPLPRPFGFDRAIVPIPK